MFRYYAMPVGRHKNKPIHALPDPYLQWACRQDWPQYPGLPTVLRTEDHWRQWGYDLGGVS